MLLLAVRTATAQEERPQRETQSHNGRYALRIEAGRPGRAGRNCRGALYERADRAARGRPVWERPMVNDTAPMLAFVRNDGRFVVTLDEHRRGGARNALVICGAEGELLRHSLLTDLLENGDWVHVRAAGRELVWLKDAKPAFSERADEFVIRLAWGREVHIDLKTLQIVRAGREAGVMVTAPPDVLALLRPEAPDRSATEPTTQPASEPGGIGGLTAEE